jgi:cell division protein FtsW
MATAATAETKRNRKQELKKAKKNAKREAAASKRQRRGSGFNRILTRFETEYDFSILLLVIILTLFGVIMVFSAGYYTTANLDKPDPYYFLKRQGFFAVTGFVIMYFVSLVDYHVYKRYGYLALIISLVFLGLLLTPLGVTVNYATRWIVILGIRITPSEISKLMMIIFTSAFLARDPSRARSFFKGILPLVIIMGIHAALIIKQPNLSTAIVVSAIMVGIMLVAGMQWRYFIGMMGILAGGITYILMFLPDTHWYARLTNWINPFADSQGDGYQVSQSIIALGNGGIFGRGLGNSVAKNLYLPEPQNDFILAIIGEELGFIGVMILLAVYLILIWRCFLVAANARDKLGLYLASGVAIMLGLQVVINVAVVTSSMPATGITLPFISYGGTSLWVFMAAMGILLNISRRKERSR